MLYRVVVLWGILLVSVIGIGGCGTTSRVLNLDTRAELEFQVKDDINPDDAGRASPLVVRFYELRDPRVFESEDFLGLFENDEERLGGDLLAKRRLKEFEPGKGRTELFVVDDNARYIGLLAEFIQYENAQARVVIPLQPNQKVEEVITVQGLRMLTGDLKDPEVKEDDSADDDNTENQYYHTAP